MSVSKKYISRKEVLQAIRYEPLQKGHWRNPDDASDGKCTVCAVGAVLRRSGMDNYEIDAFGESLIYNFQYVSTGSIVSREDENEKIEMHLGNKAFLPALSLKFECQASRTGTGKRTRKILSNFVKANFPKKIKLTSI